MGQTVLELRGVSRIFSVKKNWLLPGMTQVRAVSDVSLELRSGETLGLVGESGCGKSTLARMAVGLLSPSSGDVLLDGHPLPQWTVQERAARIQMFFQDPYSSLDPRQSVGTSIAEPLLFTGRSPVSHAETLQRVQELLKKVGLQPEHAIRYPHEFSGGQRQRIAIARSLAAGARTLVCDEPVSALDASVQAQVLNLLKELQEQHELSYLFISHDLGVIGFMSDRVAVMYLGRIMEIAACEELFRQPAHPYTKALLAAAPSRDPQKKYCHPLLSGEMPSPLAPPSGCPFHPRCPYVRPLCREQLPPLCKLQNGHLVSCFFPFVS